MTAEEIDGLDFLSVCKALEKSETNRKTNTKKEAFDILMDWDELAFQREKFDIEQLEQFKESTAFLLVIIAKKCKAKRIKISECLAPYSTKPQNENPLWQNFITD